MGPQIIPTGPSDVDGEGSSNDKKAAMKTAVDLHSPSTLSSLSSQQVELKNRVPGCKEEKANVLSV